MKTKKKHLNESGLVLISLTFILLSMVLVIFLTAYSLGNEARKDTRRYITDMRNKRFTRALLGQRMEQSLDRTPIGMGGFMADFGLNILEPHGSHAGDLYNRRYVKTADKGKLWMPDFFYNPSQGTWSGYRGRRYLYPSPAEEWVEAYMGRTSGDTWGQGAAGWKNGEGDRFWLYMSCAGGWDMGYGPHFGVGDGFQDMIYRSYLCIKVKDYTCRTEGALKLKIVLNKNGYPHGMSEVDDGVYPKTETFAGYNMHNFFIYLESTQKEAVRSQRISRMTIYLQTENPAGSGNYVTMETYPLLVQVKIGEQGGIRSSLFIKHITWRG